MQFKMVHAGNDRDSLLYFLTDDLLDLVLQYRIQLVRVEPTTFVNDGGHRAPGDGTLRDDEGNTFNLQKWEEWEWHAFQSNFTPVVIDFWNGRFELTPNRAWYKRTVDAPIIAPKVACDLSIDLVHSPARAHHRYFIIKPREDTFRSWVSHQRRTGMFTDRDMTPEVRRLQTRVKGRRSQVSFFQSTVLHEFGHTLGLDHVRGDGNDDDAYGITLDERSKLMGMGGNVGPGQAQPWITQLRRHLIRHGNEQRLRFQARVVKPQTSSYMYIG